VATDDASREPLQRQAKGGHRADLLAGSGRAWHENMERDGTTESSIGRREVAPPDSENFDIFWIRSCEYGAHGL
jgi:hypothetical protein